MHKKHGIRALALVLAMVMVLGLIPAAAAAPALSEAKSFQTIADEYVLETVQEQCAVDVKEIIEKINGMNREVVFLGDGVSVYEDQIKDLVKVPYSFAPASCNRQRAACIGVLGMKLYQKGISQTAAEHSPDYLRLSQAERERGERLNA